MTSIKIAALMRCGFVVALEEKAALGVFSPKEVTEAFAIQKNVIRGIIVQSFFSCSADYGLRGSPAGFEPATAS